MRQLILFTALAFGLASLYLLAAGRQRPPLVVDPAPFPANLPQWPGRGEPILLIENYLCPHCRAFDHKHFAQLQATGRPILIVNTTGRFPGDELLTRAATCVRRLRPEAYWDFRKALYAPRAARPDLAKVAARLNVKPDVLESCQASETVKQEVRLIDQYATSLGLRNTPTLVADGLAYVGPNQAQLDHLFSNP